MPVSLRGKVHDVSARSDARFLFNPVRDLLGLGLEVLEPLRFQVVHHRDRPGLVRSEQFDLVQVDLALGDAKRGVGAP